MKNSLLIFFDKFEKKYASIEYFDSQWYRDNCGVIANCAKAPAKDKKKCRSEEWYRARIVWSLIESGMYPSENICVEFPIPKGSKGAKSLKPDIVVFKTKNWIKPYTKWDKSKAVPEELRREFLVFWEIKRDAEETESAITKQLSSAMREYEGDQVFGAYADQKQELLLFKKEGVNPIKRYYAEKNIDGEDIEKLNLNNRDALSDFPPFTILLDNIRATEDLSKLNLETNQPIDEDSFAQLLEVANRMQDRLNISHLQDLIVEFLTLKVSDEKEVKQGLKKYFEFYILPEEINQGYGTQNFRTRIEKLYSRTKEKYHSIFNPRLFVYQGKQDALKPQHGDDEKFLIGLIQVFQKKTILETQNKNFNQIIFNNFGSNIEKAREKQFFTPVPVVEAMVKMINPQKEETICDPCAGICDFLAMAFRHMYDGELEKLPAADRFYGFDKDSKILKLAELNLVLNGDGNANINIMDSITDKLLVDGNYRNTAFTTDNYNKEDWTSINDEDKNPRRYNIILTNPPFGKNRDLNTGRKGKWDVNVKTMQLYETWELLGRPPSIDMGVIFLENAYKSLEEGGRMAIVLSNSIASIAQWEPIRSWFISKMRLVALFNLPANTFGESGVCTTVFIAYKPKSNELNLLKEDYEVYIKDVRNVGYSVQTKDRIVIMSPIFSINETTFEREKDGNGNDKRLTDLPDLVNGFADWLEDNKHTYRHIYKAFHGDNFKRWKE